MLVVPHLRPPMMIRFGSCAWRLRRRRQAALAVGRVALAGAVAHRLVGGVWGRRLGGSVRVGIRHERASLAAMPFADLGSSFSRFFNSAAEFFRHLSEIDWTPFGIALLCLLAMQLARAWAWRNVLRAAYPDAADPLPAAQPPPTWPGPGSTRSSPPTPAT